MKNFSNFAKFYFFKNSNLNIFIFGAGTIGRLSDLALKKEGFDVTSFIDSDIRKQGNKIQNKKIISPNELKILMLNKLTYLLLVIILAPLFLF